MYYASDIFYQHGSREILRNINISLVPGQLLVVLGPNGAGKSTLLKILSGEIKHYKGYVQLSNKPLKQYDERELATHRGVLSQNTSIHFPYSVREVALLGCLPLRMSNDQKEKLVSLKLAEVGMEGLQHRLYRSLSGGEQQRVQLARVLVQMSNPVPETKFLLLDEPTSSLDMASQHLILNKAKTLCAEGFGVMAILHDLNLAAQYADTLFFLKDGKRVAAGPVKQAFTSEIISHTFQYPVSVEHIGPEACPMIITKSTTIQTTSTFSNLSVTSQNQKYDASISH